MRAMHRACAISALSFLALSASTFAQGGDHGKAALEANPNLTAIPGSIIVRFDDSLAEEARATIRFAAEGRRVRGFGMVPGLEQMTVRDTDRALLILNQLPQVVYAEPDYVLRPDVTPNDQYYSLQWGAENTGQDIRGTLGVPDADVDAEAAWDITTGDANFVIAVIDSGVQWDHPDLAANIWSNTDEIAGNGVDDDGNGYVDDVRGWDYWSNDNNPDDGDGHGTHVAGTIGAIGNNGIGVAGMNWQCKIMPLRFIGPFGGSTGDAILAIEYAVDNGASISNNSWGGGGFSTALRDTIDAAGAAGHLFVAAAGNDGTNTDSSPHYPSSYDLDNIISVANLTNTDALSGTSNYGAVSVDLGAPGNDIASTYSGNNYAWSSGTSMASPHVAGVAALVWSENPGWSWSQVKSAIMDNTRPVAALAGISVTGGALNAYAALTGQAPPPPPPPPPPPAVPDAPSNPGASDNADGTAEVTWSDNSNNEDGFEIEREKQHKSGSWRSTTTISAAADATSLTDSSGDGTFRYRVRAFNGAGASAWTNWVQVDVTGGGGGGGGGGGKGGGKPPK